MLLCANNETIHPLLYSPRCKCCFNRILVTNKDEREILRVGMLEEVLSRTTSLKKFSKVIDRIRLMLDRLSQFWTVCTKALEKNVVECDEFILQKN